MVRTCIVRRFICGKFSTARLEVLPNLSHAVVFQLSTMVNLGIGFQFMSLHGAKNWIYCTFDKRQKLSQIWYWL